jgi:hypothetical protein
MNVVVVHFHFRRGGVSAVMLKQAAGLAALPRPPRIAFIVGTPAEAPVPVPVYVVPALDYDSFTGARAQDRTANAEVLARSLERTIAEAFPEGCDLVHVHNPLLCKNSALLGALRLLQNRGRRLFVQVHDMAEDFRPQAYEPYWPYLEDCDYAAINRRDRDRLVAAGLDSEQVRFLPNPVSPITDYSPRGPSVSERTKRLRTVLYPVRAIRRKNLGETLLLSRFLPGNTEIAVTLPPTSPGDRQRYESWKAAARESGLPVRFEAGAAESLQTLYGRSFLALTTSVKEGFGYSYLDPLVRGLPVAGRSLPVIEDFRQAGLSFENLYPAIRIHRSELPLRPLGEAVEACLARLGLAYAPAFAAGSGEWESILDDLRSRFAGDFLDFGALEEEFQVGVLNRMRTDRGFEARIIQDNPFLETLFDSSSGQETVLRQRELILDVYSEREYGRRLLAAYEHALADAPRGRIDKAILIAQYLKPASFYGVAS